MAQVTEIFLTIENYLFRRTMCDLPTNALNKIFLMLHREIVRYDGTEDKDVYRHCDDGTYSIEHIMPQHLTPEWQKELGADYEQIHELWLHRIANLTLTAYNAKYSNHRRIWYFICEMRMRLMPMRRAAVMN